MQNMLLLASVLVFIIGVPLVLLTTQTESYFAWTIGSALTAAFLGGAYWSSGVLEFMAAREKEWAQARIAVPAVLLFTVLTLIVTLIHIENFHFDAPARHTVAGTWAWLVVYAVVPLIMGWLLLSQRTLTGDDPVRTTLLPTWTRGVLVVQAVLMLPVGVALLLSPLLTARIWPWELTPLTGRAIGAWLVSIGVIVAHAVYENDWGRLRSFAVSYTLLAVMQVLALLRFGSEIDWTAPAGWIYMFFLLSIGVVGLSGLMHEGVGR
jgi:mannose/fructose/N-acetylgalactosamine-specific phosphotransferase system component IIC